MAAVVAVFAALTLAAFAGGIYWGLHHPGSPAIEEIVPCGGETPHPPQAQ